MDAIDRVNVSQEKHLMDTEQRINQFKNMAEADPENELGHFSLGKAYLDAGRPTDAIPPLKRTIDLNNQYSKAYQLLAEALLATNQQAEAVTTLIEGFKIAAERGDVMPRDAMANKLRELGQEPPTIDIKSLEKATGRPADGSFQCTRCGRPSDQLPERPFKGPLGEKILAQICAPCWQEWIHMGTKVINELSLQLSTPHGAETYDAHMKEFLQIED
jgi:Fe-S cluster biosynthesis and repair protein YggX/uncharacterized protein HemY